MRKPLLILLAAAACGSLLTGCRTSQENMNAAYQAAVAAKDVDNDDDDETIYTAVRRQMKESTMVVAGDTVPVRIQFVSVTDDRGATNETLKRYCVVVGQFKMQFNASSMCQRLADSGFPGAFVVQTKEPYFFVVAQAFTSPTEAVDFLNKTRADGKISMKEPCPFILEPSQLRR